LFIPVGANLFAVQEMGRRRALIAIILLVSAACALRGTSWAEDYLDYFEQGEFALRVEKWDRAIELFTKSIAGEPKYFRAYHYRAIAYSKKGDYDSSIEDLKSAVRLSPDFPDAYGLMGLVYEIKKDYPSASEAYKEALAREKRPAVKKSIQKYLQDVEVKLKKK
jgi:tetratricopeptide (TPR) repeat protein